MADLQSSRTHTELRHGLRTPLNHIIGYAELLLEEAGSADAWEDAQCLRELLCEAQALCDVVVKQADPQVMVGDELEQLRNEMRPLLVKLQRKIQALDALDRASSKGELRRIVAAAHELSEFVEFGTLAYAPVRQPPTATADQISRVAHGLLLVVDDDEANRDILQRHLERQGYSVEQASGGEEAIRMLRVKPFDAVLLDLLMPDMNGIEVLQALKCDSDLADIPVLVVSASDGLATVADSIRRGAEDYLLKPFEPDLLRARLTATLERKRLRDRERQKGEELEQVSRALSRSNDDLQRFAYAASHDLQTPLRTIISYMQLLEKRLSGRLTEEDRELLIFAQDAGKRMSTLVQDLLAFSQVSTQERLEEPVACEVVVQSIVHDFQSLIEESQAQITYDPLPTVLADWARMRQLFQNLISNAIKYRREEAPSVHILASKDGDFWRLGVRDNGQGIEAQYHEKVFETFQRLHGEETPGNGIGLAICHRIVERLGGRIWFESTPGKGSTFWFTLPIDP